MPEPLRVQREIQIAAPPATVFALLTDPEKIVSWMGAEVTIEAQPGASETRRQAAHFFAAPATSHEPRCPDCVGLSDPPRVR